MKKKTDFLCCTLYMYLDLCFSFTCTINVSHISIFWSFLHSVYVRSNSCEALSTSVEPHCFAEASAESRCQNLSSVNPGKLGCQGGVKAVVRLRNELFTYLCHFHVAPAKYFLAGRRINLWLKSRSIWEAPCVRTLGQPTRKATPPPPPHTHTHTHYAVSVSPSPAGRNLGAFVF